MWQIKYVIYLLPQRPTAIKLGKVLITIRDFNAYKPPKPLKIVSATFLLVCFVSLKESTFETRKNVFYFTSKALFVLELLKF